MLSPADVSDMMEKQYYIKTYSYEDSFEILLTVLKIVLIITIINVIMALVMGVRKKDLIVILVTNIMVKTVLILLSILKQDFLNLITLIFLIVAIIYIEGLIYKKVLKYKTFSGMTLSAICNYVALQCIIFIPFIPSLNEFFEFF